MIENSLNFNIIYFHEKGVGVLRRLRKHEILFSNLVSFNQCNFTIKGILHF